MVVSLTSTGKTISTIWRARGVETERECGIRWWVRTRRCGMAREGSSRDKGGDTWWGHRGGAATIDGRPHPQSGGVGKVARSSSEVCDQRLVRGIVVTFVKYCDMHRLGRGDDRCPHKVLQRCRRGLSIGVYANGNAAAANVSGLDRAFVTEDDVSREKGDIAGHAHVPGASESIIPPSSRPSELEAFCATRACLRVVCGRLATEKRGPRGERRVRIRKKSSGARGTYPLRVRWERALSLRGDAVRGSPTVATVVERCAARRLWELGAWVYMVSRTLASAHRESRFAAACSHLSELRPPQPACVGQTRAGNWDETYFPGFRAATNACWCLGGQSGGEP